MNNDEQKYDRVVAYIRKSSEDNEKGEANKQQNSIEYQRRFVKDAVEKHALTLVHAPFEDSKSAYEAFARPDFDSMLDYLKEHKNEVDGIACTEVSRLARNFADGGMILWYMQCGIIKRIYTITKVFTNSSTDQMMVAIEFAMSKKSSDDTGMRTMEGMLSKALTLKHPPRPAILGYKGEGPVGARKWIIDPVEGPLVKQVFEQFSTGNYTFEEIAEYAYSIGLRSKDSKSSGGKIAKNTWHGRLRDLQYTGVFEYKNNRIAGDYEPLIPSDLFYRDQEVINGNGHPKEKHITYAYSRMIVCGDCGGMLSGTHKKGITYYRCGKRKSPCKGAKDKYVPEKLIEKFLMPEFKSFEIDQDTWKAARNYVVELNQPHALDVRKQIRILGEQIESETSMQTVLGRKFAESGYSKGEYDRLMKDSYQRETALRRTLIKCENIAHELEESMYGFLDSIKYLTERFEIAFPENKREMVDIFCENLIWEDEKLRWNWKKPYNLLLKHQKSSTMLPRLDSNQEPSP